MLKGNKVWTPNGYQAGPVNSLVGKGESIIDYTNGTGTLVTKGKVGVDNQPSSVRRDDDNVIAGNDIDWSNGMKFSDQVAPLTAKLQMYNDIEKRAGKKSDLSSLSKQTIELQKNQLDRAKAPILQAMKNITDQMYNDIEKRAGKKSDLSSLSKQTIELQKNQLDRAKAPILQAMKNITDRQEKQHQIEDYAAQIKHNCGKDRFDKGKSFWKSYTTGGKGKISNLMLDTGYALPALLETQMLNHWRRENPVMPNIYAANRYAPIALQTMAGNRVSANPVLEKLYAQDRQAAYQLANSGGYTGGQRQANRVALALGNQRNVADALMNVQEKNAAYRNAYAEMAARLGDSDAQRLQQSNQYGWEAYNRSHGAKTKGIETHLSNLGLIGQKWLSQRIKNKQYGDILDMYQQDIDNKKDALKTIYGIGADGSKDTAASVSTNKASNASGSSSINYRNIAPGWTPSQYQLFSGSPNVPYQGTGINRGVLNLKYDDYSLNNLKAPYGKYWYIDTDKVADSAKYTRNWAKSKEQYQRGAFSTPYEIINFSSDYTGGFGPNGLFLPTWAGSTFDYNPYNITSLRLRK